MTAVQAMAGQGGWPMSVFLTPDGEPFWAATYLPDAPRHGMPSFRQVLEGIAEAWRSAAARSRHRAAGHVGHRSRRDTRPRRMARRRDRMWRCAGSRRRSTNGGAGSGARRSSRRPLVLGVAPATRPCAGDARRRARWSSRTLDGMASGGIHDHVVGGFARYSTDPAWHVPHFEKMLYDNAQLLTLYTRAWLHTRERPIPRRRVVDR